MISSHWKKHPSTSPTGNIRKFAKEQLAIHFSSGPEKTWGSSKTLVNHGASEATCPYPTKKNKGTSSKVPKRRAYVPFSQEKKSLAPKPTFNYCNHNQSISWHPGHHTFMFTTMIVLNNYNNNKKKNNSGKIGQDFSRTPISFFLDDVSWPDFLLISSWYSLVITL